MAAHDGDADRVIRWSTGGAVVGVAAVAAVVSCEHVSSLVRAPGGGGAPEGNGADQNPDAKPSMTRFGLGVGPEAVACGSCLG
jgi:hypothetical protein